MRYIFYMLFFCTCSVFAQSEADLDSLLDKNQAELAEKKINELFDQYIQNENFEQLPPYLEVYGRIQLALTDEATAIKKVDLQIEAWDKLLKTPKNLKDLYNSASSWYEYMGMMEKSYDAKLRSYSHAKNQPEPSLRELGVMQVNLGGNASKRMDIPAAKLHLAEAQRLLDKEPDPESIYLLHNYLGNMAYFASKLDSAEFYYTKCIEALETTTPNPKNSFYRPAIVYNNLSGVQFAQGKTTEAIASMNMTIDKLNAYLEVEEDPSILLKTKEFYFQALDNLGSVYKGLGNYGKAQSLLEFSYHGKKRELIENNKAFSISEIFLGQLYFDQGEVEKAKNFTLKGIQGLKNIGGFYQHYESDGLFTLARIEDHLGNTDLAESYYRRAYQSFKEMLGDELDFVFLDFLRFYSEFLAKNNRGKEAAALALDSYDYVKDNAGTSAQLFFRQELNIGEVYLHMRNYSEAEKWSRNALNTLEHQKNNANKLLDSIQSERYKPAAILLNTKAKFLGNNALSKDDLKSMIETMENGLNAIEQRKTFLDSEEDIALLISENTDYFRFIEKLYLELYRKSPREDYLARLLVLHESALYQKVRARLDQLDISRFGSIPAEFFQQEKRIKDQLRKTVSNHTGGMQEYLSSISEWEEFLQNARINYPEYYEFRYGSLNFSMDEIYNKIPAATSVVRYIQVEDEMIALLIPNGERKLLLFDLDYPSVKKTLATYQSQWNDQAQTFSNLNVLYRGLWAPFAFTLSSKRVLIIPDGPLFNLSFEALTPDVLKEYSELSSSTLLAKYSFTYHYSTLLFAYPQQDFGKQSNFVAFAPGFFDEMKTGYLATVKDTLQVDKSYMRLLPQPFTDKLVTQLQKSLGGKVYSKNRSTLDHFSEEAGKYRILHIATHAESDNISPAYSRLIFAKTSQHEENSLFAKDIYQMDLKSELSVLMACETGKPSYQPGEGMISLAHAFNYAGSKSLLIGLWKIDEQSSAKIGADFYEYIQQGKTKDEALRMAKLDYLASSQGRTLSPEFWAGLIILGDPSPIALDSNVNFKMLLALSIFLLVTVFLIVVWRRRT